MDLNTRTYAQPVTRDGFFYDGCKFYVEIKNGSRMERVERESSQRLYDLLTWSGPPPPLLTKKGTVAARQPPPHKDPNVAFYCGQLVHYGLKQLKTKEPAKKHLLAAYGNDRNLLKVPEHILKIESDLVAEFVQANATAKKAYEEEKRKREAEAAQQRSGQLERARKERMFDRTRTAEMDSDDEASDASDSDVVKVSKKDIKAAVKSMPETELKKWLGSSWMYPKWRVLFDPTWLRVMVPKKRGFGKGQQAGKKRKVKANVRDEPCSFRFVINAIYRRATQDKFLIRLLFRESSTL
ncbi:hypothetical protein MPER_10175 [Moniliophthora perniciosa FA553]|nr:hypothetical protein MPER_10175 [Moniliophthora perniciosa FA553]